MRKTSDDARPRRPLVTPDTVRALGAVRACASIELDSGNHNDPVWRANLARGIRYSDDLRAWFEALHGKVD